MKNIIIYSTILLAVFVGDASASPGVSLKGNGLSFGNIRGEGKIVDGLSLTLGSLDLESKPLDEINGVSLTIFSTASKLRGLHISPLFASSEEMTGIVIGGLLAGGREKMTGIAISVLGTGGRVDRGEMTGIAIGSLVFGGKVTGVAIGLVAVGFREMNGIAVGLATTSGDELSRLNGLALGVFNSVDEVYGVQFGVFNGFDLEVGFSPIIIPNLFKPCTGEVTGVQVGLFNCTEQLNGIQIGLINYAGNNPDGFKWLPLINAHF